MIPPRRCAGVRVLRGNEVFDLAHNDHIRLAVERASRSSVVLVRMETDVCIAHSAVGLVDLDYRVAAVTDALFAPGDAHDHGLERLRGSGVELVSATGLFYEWLPSLAKAQAFKASHPELAAPGFHR